MKTSLSILLAACLATTAVVQAADGKRHYVVTDTSPARAQLPFSDAVQAGDTLYVSGTLGMDPATASDPKGARVAAEPADEARYALEAVRHTLEAAGYTM